MRTNYVEHLAWYERSVKPYITTPHSHSTRCWNAAKDRPPRTLDDIRQQQQQRLQEQQYAKGNDYTRTRKRIRIETDTEDEEPSKQDAKKQMKIPESSIYTNSGPDDSSIGQDLSVSPFLRTMEAESPESPPFTSDEEGWRFDNDPQLVTTNDVSPDRAMTNNEKDFSFILNAVDDILNLETENLQISSQQQLFRTMSETTIYYDAKSDADDADQNLDNNQAVDDLNSSINDSFNDVCSSGTDSCTREEDQRVTITSILKTVFYVDSKIPNQYESIIAAMNGEDMLLVMPSGESRRICYILPACMNYQLQQNLFNEPTGKITIVIMPSTADLKQHDNPIMEAYRLRSYQFVCKALNENKRNWISRDNLQMLFFSGKHQQRPQLLFITHHDFFQSINMLTALYKEEAIARFVVEEAHCITQWGTEASEYFKFGYLRLANILRKTFPNIPITAVTAIPNERIHLDILHQLHIDQNQCKIFKKSIFLNY